MTDAERLQHHLNMLRGEPLIRLTGREAIEQAYRLRARGFSFPSVALIMGVYHGEWYTSQRWREECHRVGPPAPLKRGGGVRLALDQEPAS